MPRHDTFARIEPEFVRRAHTMIAFHPWRIRVADAGTPHTHQVWTATDAG